jgi:hypothetical protein
MEFFIGLDTHIQARRVAGISGFRPANEVNENRTNAVCMLMWK